MKLTPLGPPSRTLEEVRDLILRHYKRTHERDYVIKAFGYQVPVLGPCGHAFNAVILDNAIKPVVQFVDAWKTSEVLPTLQQLQSRMHPDTQFIVYCLC